MASDAEARIRDKAAAYLRKNYPNARIVHELVLSSGNIRIDLAAITENKIVVVEIKSERDTLKRLGAQVEFATYVANEIIVFINEKHTNALKAAIDFSRYGESLSSLRQEFKEFIATHHDKNNKFTSAQENAISTYSRILIERENTDTFEVFNKFGKYNPSWHSTFQHKRILGMLWASELTDICRKIGSRYPFKIGSKNLRICDATEYILEHATGREIRQFVCQALLKRQFAYADEPVKEMGAA
jgi:hypothetical protein